MKGARMEKMAARCILMLIMTTLPATISAEDTLARADRLFSTGEPAGYLESATLYSQFSDAHPGSYEAAWKACRSYRHHCLDCLAANAGSRRDLCGKSGKLGMKYGERAMAIAPGRVEGNFWYGCSLACYVQGISTLTALREGLKDKARASFERAYAIDRMYDEGGPVKALGRYWYVLPWPMKDRKKALTYLREYQKLFPNDPEGQVYLAEVLLDLGKKDEARALLRRAASSNEPYFSRRAAAILAKS
jgi:tetratricopeptide (TPR) repeat protein